MQGKSCYIFCDNDTIICANIANNLKFILETLITKNNVRNFYFNERNYYSEYCLTLLKKYMVKFDDIETTLIENNYNIITKNNKNDFEILVYEHTFINKYLLAKNKYIIDNCNFIIFTSLNTDNKEKQNTFLYAKNKKDCEILTLI